MNTRHRAFTITELMICIVAVIVLLSISNILLSCGHSDSESTAHRQETAQPQSEARPTHSDTAAPDGKEGQLTASGVNTQNMRLRSQANLRQLAMATATYATEWNDNQFSVLPHPLAAYGDSFDAAIAQYEEAAAGPIQVHLGVRGEESIVLNIDTSERRRWLLPISFDASPVGSFRMLNLPGFNSYVSGKFYDSVFYAPADRIVLDALDDRLGQGHLAGSDVPHPEAIIWSSYCFSPAALYSPAVFNHEHIDSDLWKEMPGAIRTPRYSQARYPDLKTHIIEHHWLYDSPEPAVIDGFQNSRYGAGEPHYFNQGVQSAPNVLFYDGHVSQLSMQDVRRDDARLREQGHSVGLWIRSPRGAVNGYYEQHSVDDFQGSPHIFTHHGILGRDTFPRR